MDHSYEPILSGEEQARRRAQRAAARKKKQQARRRRLLLQTAPFAILAIILVVFLLRNAQRPKEEPDPEAPAVAPAAMLEVQEEPEEPVVYTISATADTVQLDDTLPSAYAVVVDRASGSILAEKSSETIINPASMTKILTLLVAAENLKSHKLICRRICSADDSDASAALCGIAHKCKNRQ